MGRQYLPIGESWFHLIDYDFDNELSRKILESCIDPGHPTLTEMNLSCLVATTCTFTVVLHFLLVYAGNF